MFNNLVVQPFALEEHELQDIERFAAKNDLINIARLCAELRSLRSAYMTMCARAGKAQAQRRSGDTHAPPVA